MNISKYLKSLLPSFGRAEVEEDIRITRAEIKEFTQPAYTQAAQMFRGWKFKSKVLEPQFDTFGRMVKQSSGHNPVETIAAAWPLVLENLESAEKLVTAHVGDTVAGAGLTYLKANLLQFVEACAFTSKFARKFLNYVYVCETSEYDEGGASVAESLAPAEIEWIKANFVTFCQAFNIVTGQPQKIRSQLENIPDIEVTEQNASHLAVTQGSKVDPMHMGLIPVWMNPIYHVGMFVAEWQADRYKQAKEELKLVELRKLNLEKLAAGKPDAAVQKEIQYLESRVEGLAFKIQKMEQAHA